MRVFILEDDPYRLEAFSAALKGTDWQTIATCKDAEQFKPPYDLILLDYDLGGRVFSDDEDCGMTFVFEVYKRINKDTQIIIHSWNSPGAIRMQYFLLGHEFRATRIPFGKGLLGIVKELMVPRVKN